MRGNLKLFELKSGRGEKLMKNILIISSSPRKKGNSQILCEQFKKGAEAKGHQVKIVRIMEQNIGFCRACGVRFCADIQKCDVMITISG